jgi:hypothetical protein
MGKVAPGGFALFVWRIIQQGLPSQADCAKRPRFALISLMDHADDTQRRCPWRDAHGTDADATAPHTVVRNAALAEAETSLVRQPIRSKFWAAL